MEFKDLQKILEKIDKLPEKCFPALLQSCVDIIEHHLKLYQQFGKCIYCEKEQHICQDMCECWKQELRDINWEQNKKKTEE